MRFWPLICLFLTLEINAQTKINNNWYFGANAAINFNTVPPSSVNNSAMNTYSSAVTVSDPQTGKLLFYSNGNSFWNAYHEMIDSSVKGPAVQDVIAIPLNAYKQQYMVFNQGTCFWLDMAARNGRGRFVQRKTFVIENSLNRITAVKHCFSESYWLISIKNNSFYAYLVHANGQIDAPVISYNSGLRYTNYLGDFVTSADGNYLGITVYSPNGTTYIEPQLFKFDKRCGTVADEVIRLPMYPDNDRPHGMAFSPDSKWVYVSYGFQESQLLQYEVLNPVNNTVIARSSENFNQMAQGPDGKIYITTHIGGIPSNKMDVIHYPNQQGLACQYQENYLRLNGNTNFEVPNMVLNHTGTCSSNSGFTIQADTALCDGQTTFFKIKGDTSGLDLIHWFFADTHQLNAQALGSKTQHVYVYPGTYQPFLVLQSCQKRDTFYFQVQVSKREIFDLGRDSTLCYGDSLHLGNGSLKGPYLWNNGDTSAYLWAKKPGIYNLSLMHKGCISSDSIQIKQHPQLKTILGDRYYICEEEKELVVLDAGKGFKKYIWLPTQDTTQWIEVRKIGAYYVVVSDYRGCHGKDEAQVDDRCNLRIFIPNAFTPNGDLLNDRLHIAFDHLVDFEVSIFNAWGELLFRGDAAHEWDGSYRGQKVPQGVYLLQVKVNGYLNKQAVEQLFRSSLHVVY